ncbi:hypothetical protein PILCRDRAFT_822108 [Piloderma croceum F 1598]|uniref:Cytochrome b mRNA-processing protein 4 n=1 Tax=Piloderma croceum (strain F 1598) TaxID=765440 RepID=A0A0C3FM24_PILCF|nr:hypothetical protein PILCRDRAFT_822108 [Piloderma croceum F 1598]
MSGFPWLRFTALAAGLMGTGYVLMKVIVPTEEQLYNRMSPDLQRKVDANRASRAAQENAMKAQIRAQLTDPDSEKPVWADPPPRSR